MQRCHVPRHRVAPRHIKIKSAARFLDRIDLHVDVDAVNPWEMTNNKQPEETSAVVRLQGGCRARQTDCARRKK